MTIDGNDLKAFYGRNFRASEEDQAYQPVDLIALLTAKGLITKVNNNLLPDDKEIDDMLTKQLKQSALRKRLIGAGIATALDLVLLGVLAYKYRQL